MYEFNKPLLYFNRGVKYQLVTAVQVSQIVHIYGPCRGGMHDKTMLEESGVLDLIQPGKLAAVDGGYIKQQHADKLSWPNPHQDPVTHNFFSRCRLRHETANGRMTFYRILSDTFRHSIEKHGAAFTAVAVTSQYAFENGHPLFTV